MNPTESETLHTENKEAYWPLPRAAHGGAILPSPSNSATGPVTLSRIFIFAGVNSDGPLNDLVYYDEGKPAYERIRLLNPWFFYV